MNELALTFKNGRATGARDGTSRQRVVIRRMAEVRAEIVKRRPEPWGVKYSPAQRAAIDGLAAKARDKG